MPCPPAHGQQPAVGIAHAAGTGVTGFDLLVREYRGADMIREEAYVGLSVTASHPRYVTRVLAAKAGLSP